jgi:hypothetical protein
MLLKNLLIAKLLVAATAAPAQNRREYLIRTYANVYFFSPRGAAHR